MNVSRYINNIKLKFTVDVVTPTFLGGPNSDAQIRTAPFKNLLRRWWRIEKIGETNASISDLWIKESELFGSAKHDDEKYPNLGQSKVFLSIDSIYPKTNDSKAMVGPYNPIETDADIKEKNVRKYLSFIGYGAMTEKQYDIKDYIKPDTQIDFTLTIPKEELNTFINILSLIHFFGSIGARAKKGFGSIDIIPRKTEDSVEFIQKGIGKLREELPYLVRKVCIEQDSHNYPYCIGEDEKGLTCWNMKMNTDFHYTSWLEVLKRMQTILMNEIKEKEISKDKRQIKKITNASLIIGNGKTINKDKDEDKKNRIERIPSQLTFKVTRNKNNYVGRIIHFPYNIDSSLTTQSKVWNKVYEKLDNIKINSNSDAPLFGRFGGNKKK